MWRRWTGRASVCTSSYLRPEAPSGPAFMPPTPCLSALGVWQQGAKNIPDSPHSLLPWRHDRVTPTEPGTRHEPPQPGRSLKTAPTETWLGSATSEQPCLHVSAFVSGLPTRPHSPSQSPSQVSTLTEHRAPPTGNHRFIPDSLPPWAPRPGGPASSEWRCPCLAS